jgi:hypothetical protein
MRPPRSPRDRGRISNCQASVSGYVGRFATGRRTIEIASRGPKKINFVSTAAMHTPSPSWSGRIEARIGLRMMPTFPRSPLSFRTASFPQYGWKADCPSGAFLGDWRLKPAPGIHRPPSSLHPLFVHFVVATAARSESGLRTRSCTAMRWNTPPTPGALARVRVVVSRSVIT